MATATTLPDDFVLEYDLLQLVDELPSSANTASTLDVDDLLGHSFLGLDPLAADTPECHVRSSSCHAAAAVTATASLAKELEADTLLNVTAGFSVVTHAADDDLAEFIINGEAFLNEMEKVVKMDTATDDDSGFLHLHPPSSPESSTSGGFQDDLDLDVLTDGDVMSSPCPSSCGCSTPMQDDLHGSFLDHHQTMWGDDDQQHAAAQDQLLLQHQQLLMMMPPPEQTSQLFTGGGMSVTYNTALHALAQQQQLQHHYTPAVDLTTTEEDEPEDIDVDVDDAKTAVRCCAF